jgi:carbon starvation protein
MHTVVTNSTVDGILAALFAAMIIVVILDSMRIWIKALRAGGQLPTFEAKHVASRIAAPAGLIVTDEDRAVMSSLGSGDGRFARTDEPATATTGSGP